MKNKKYILFDNDGVLVETEPLYFQASKRAVKEFFDIKLEFEDYMEIMTHGGTAWQKAEKLGYSQKEIARAREQRNIYYQEYIKQNDVVIDGVVDTIKELSKKYKMAIVTTARRVDFELKHQNSGIVDMMEFVLCEGEYPRSKPHPDPYLKALEIFGAKRDEAIVVEDSARGLKAAYGAGIECIIVHNEFTKTQDFSLATYKIKDIRELLELL